MPGIAHLFEGQNFEHVLGSATDAMIVANQQGQILFSNAAMERLAGYAQGEMLALTVEDLLPARFRKAHVGQRGQYGKQPRSRPMGIGLALFALRKDGSEFPVDISLSPLKTEGGLLTLATIHDITRRKLAEERLAEQTARLQDSEARLRSLLKELEAKNAELEQFVYTVSHDLKSPLITIQGFSGMLEQTAAKGDTARMLEDINRIRAAAAKMQMLLDDLLELSRIGRVVKPPVHVSLADLAREAAELVAGQAASRGVQIDISPGLPTIVGDRQRLLEVLQNLLDNAIKFMGGQSTPRVEIGAREEGGETICFVRDNGIGIASHNYEKVFGLFEQLDQTGEGTGIGLAIVKRVIDGHGGRIWVESAGPGRGSTFYFSIPAMKNSSKPEA